ncbi:YHS domain protein [Halomonas campisalis]|uniref:YHS domain protein n=1 Tax=Billgrantia campisalis TaxID=74661 RepID=A0ABS9P9I5_9GAMM|nr:YHS domain-containing (seleno)protein [Halomonas campisalis]MCG6657907.1 YHS domain protein [Halomonas campisalis]MDR5863569.1 YHS domain-containing (seleno)protein [Halomonas campisalis]
MKRTSWMAAMVMVLGLAWALETVAEERIFTRDGLAIGGTDPVAYFTQGQPVQGSPDYRLEWRNATWKFASAEHRDRFEANPEAYAPQYGGWCAWAAARGEAAATIPEAWKIVDDKLYLNFNHRIQRRWEANIPAYIEAADERWPNIF